MLKRKFSINLIIFLFFFFFFLVISIIVYIQYYRSKEILFDNFINKHTVEALNIKDKFKNVFDEALYIYKTHEKLNMQNAFKLNDFYNNGYFDINKAFYILNSTLDVGKYEIFQIDRNYKIVNGTYSADIGYDLGEFTAFRKILDEVFSGKKRIDISPIYFDISSKNLKKYYLVRSKDEKYLLQLAYVVDIYPKLKSLYEFIKPAMEDLKLYFVSKYLVYPIKFDKRIKKKLSLDKIWEFSKNFLLYIDHQNGVNIDSAHKEELSKKIFAIFDDHNGIVYKIKGDILKIFVLIKGVINNKDNSLIIETDFNLKPLHIAQDKLFENFLIIVLFIAIFIAVFYFFAQKYFIESINLLTKSFKNHTQCEVGDNFIKEISELKENYNDLFNKLNSEIKKNKELLLLNRRFIVDTIHQIRTPLNVILLNIELLRDFCDEKEILDEVEASVSMLSNSYEDLAYISSNNIVEYKPSLLDISEILKERVEFFKRIAKSHNKKFITDIDENMEFNINKIELERIIDNNISNAIKYSKKSEIFISLKKMRDKFVLKFETYGERIKDSKNVFEKNYREQSHKRGLGIGLNIVKQICDKYKIRYTHYYQNGKNIFEYQFMLKF